MVEGEQTRFNYSTLFNGVGEETNRASSTQTEPGSEKYPQELWMLVQWFAEFYLGKGRPNFDVPHTHGVVFWVYALAQAYNNEAPNREDIVDVKVLITAAWLHDIGYYGQFEQTADFSAVQNKKTMHMLVGALMAQNFLSKYASFFLSSEQIEQVVQLIRIHDDLDQITTTLETILVEADTLGMMDVNWVEPTYRNHEALNFPEIDGTKKRFSLFKTKLGVSVLPEIVQRFKQFVIDRDFNGEEPRE